MYTAGAIVVIKENYFSLLCRYNSRSPDWAALSYVLVPLINLFDQIKSLHSTKTNNQAKLNRDDNR